MQSERVQIAHPHNMSALIPACPEVDGRATGPRPPFPAEAAYARGLEVRCRGDVVAALTRIGEGYAKNRPRDQLKSSPALRPRRSKVDQASLPILAMGLTPF